MIPSRDCTILIPYREDHGERDVLMRWVFQRLSLIEPGVQVIVGTDDSEPFNRAAARNDAFRQSDTPFVAFVDGDTVFRKGLLTDALRQVESGVPWVLPYTTYYNATQAHTKELLEGDPFCWLDRPREWEHALTDSVAGVVVVPREAVERVGGYDERFTGWGGEDRAFAAALDTMWGPCLRLGHRFVLHLWHERGTADFTQPEWPKNAELLRRYQRAYGRRDRMSEVLQ